MRATVGTPSFYARAIDYLRQARGQGRLRARQHSHAARQQIMLEIGARAGQPPAGPIRLYLAGPGMASLRLQQGRTVHTAADVGSLEALLEEAISYSRGKNPYIRTAKDTAKYK